MLFMNRSCAAFSVFLSSSFLLFIFVLTAMIRHRFTMQNLGKKAGFEKKQLRTQNYKIRTVYRNVETETGNYETVFSGYECEQEFLLKFPMDIQRLNSVLKSIDICEVKPVFDIKFTLSNARAAHD